MPHHISSRRRLGAILPLVAILLPIILIIGGMVINIAYMELARTQLQVASDAATRAAGYTLATTGNQALSLQSARDASKFNPVAGTATKIAAGDVVFGVAQRSGVNARYTFTPGGKKVNAVRVDLKRSAASGSGVVKMLLPMTSGVKTFAPVVASVSSQVELDVALVLDRSGSMAYSDVENSYNLAVAGTPPAAAPPGWKWNDPVPPNSRWLDLVDAVNIFLTALKKSPQSENVCMVTYNGSSLRDVSLTNNYTKVPTALDAYTKKFDKGKTNIGDGIVDGINALNDPLFSRPWAVQAVIVLTDGIHNIGTDPEYAADQAFSQGVTVYTVTFSDEADIPRMKSVAAKGGGQHFHAATGAELKAVFSSIADSLPSLLVQ